MKFAIFFSVLSFCAFEIVHADNFNYLYNNSAAVMANCIIPKKLYVQQFLQFADNDGKYPSDCEYNFNKPLSTNGKYQEMDACCKNGCRRNITRKAKRCADGKSKSYKGDVYKYVKDAKACIYDLH